ncbi:MAG: class I SAM-dependent methyltransferase [Solirubrobacteraceae bacterium]
MRMRSLSYRAARWIYLRAQTRVRPRILSDTFVLEGRTYPLFLHETGMTWRSERIVEVPIGLEALQAAPDQTRVLEVGNVLRQYRPDSRHTVVDKYERAPGVINQDAETFTGGPYDAIISLSTIEHIGWDETSRDPAKIPRVIERLRSLLAPGGRLTVTVPHRWNRDLDELLAADALPFDTVSYLQRLDFSNRHWRQVQRADIERIWYGHPYVGANAVAIARLTAR